MSVQFMAFGSTFPPTFWWKPIPKASSLALKRMVNQIVLVSGDGDFVPAAKLARREGIDVILDPMWAPIGDSLHEHIDGLRSTSPRPASFPAS